MHNGLSLRKGCRLLNYWQLVFFTIYRTRFLAFPGQIGGFSPYHNFGD
jgi:hypothetical protein